MKFAAIDICSNAVRLLLTRVFENGSQPYFKKESLIRMPVRLGDEAFTRHRISDQKAGMLLHTMIGFKYLLGNLVADENWQDMKHWIKKNVVNMENVLAIGSGGNINKIFKLARQKTGRPLSYKTLRDIYKSLDSFTYQERIRVLGLKPDRADVIIPASRIYTSVMKWGKINKIYVPEIGLADGIIHVLYEKYKRKIKSYPGVPGFSSA